MKVYWVWNGVHVMSLIFLSPDIILRILTCYQKLSYVVPTLSAHSDAVIGGFFLDSNSIVSVARDGSCFFGGMTPEDMWKLLQKTYFDQGQPRASSICYVSKNSILTIVFTNGTFSLYEVSLRRSIVKLHELSISQQKIKAVATNANEEWLAFGRPEVGQLIAWECQ
jgi:hypothetical protein